MAENQEGAEVRDRSYEVILVGIPRTEASDNADLLLDGITMALQQFDTETLLAIADHRDEIRRDGWMQQLIREYVDVWR